MPARYRHGDVELIACDEHESAEVEARTKGTDIVLEYGEATGHAHRISSPHVQALRLVTPIKDNPLRLLKVDKPAALTHEEHKTIKLPPGKYMFGPKRQYSPDGWESVRD